MTSMAGTASEDTLSSDIQDTEDLYTILDIEKTATAVDIKRAYRRLALQHHPDRNPGVDGTEFVRMQYAYDILSDERKRRIYDRYGQMGIQMADRMGGEFLDPQVSSLLSLFALASALVSLMLIVFFALLAARVDGRRQWPFGVVFTPLWITDAVVVGGMLRAMVERFRKRGSSRRENDNNDGESIRSDNSSTSFVDANNDADSDADAPTDTTPLFSSNEAVGGSHQQQQQQTRRRRRNRSSGDRMRAFGKFAESQFASLSAAAPLTYVLLIVAFQISLVLRLDGKVHWSVWRVFVPWLCIEAIHFILLTLSLLVALTKPDNQQQPMARRMAAEAAEKYWWLLIRLLQITMVILKLNHTLKCDWFLVFVPTYVPLVQAVVMLYRMFRQMHNVDSPES
ncbi:hypothetical protein GGF37_004065, partial [Kickxella alabastrina]